MLLLWLWLWLWLWLCVRPLTGSLLFPAAQPPYDYSRSDVWGLGCLAYQMIKEPHPWTRVEGGLERFSLRKYTREEVLAITPPRMPDGYARLQRFVDAALVVEATARLTAQQAVSMLREELWPLAPKREHALAQLHLWTAQTNSSLQEFRGDGDRVRFQNLEQYLEASMLVDRIQQLDAGTKRQLAARSHALALDSSESDASSDAGGSAASDTDL